SHSDIEMFRDFLLNEFDADGGAAFFMEDFPKKVFNDLSREFFSCEGSVGGNAKQGTLQASNIGADAFGEKVHDLVGQVQPERLFLLAQNGEPRFDIRGLQVGDQAPFET